MKKKVYVTMQLMKFRADWASGLASTGWISLWFSWLCSVWISFDLWPFPLWKLNGPSGPRLHIDIPKGPGRKRIVVWFYADWTSSGNMFICESWIVARGMMDYVLLKLFFFFLKQYSSFSVSGLFYFRVVVNYVKWTLVYAGS